MRRWKEGFHEMNWLLQIETELSRLQPNQHPGRMRTIARRIAGIALKEWYQSSGEDFLSLIHQASNDAHLPNDVRASSNRLAARLSSDFTSPSVDPIGDAKSIVEFVKKEIEQRS
jgi:hypothetical protein